MPGGSFSPRCVSFPFPFFDGGLGRVDKWGGSDMTCLAASPFPRDPLSRGLGSPLYTLPLVLLMLTYPPHSINPP